MARSDEFTLEPNATESTPGGDTPDRWRASTRSHAWPWAALALVLVLAGVVTSPGGERPVRQLQAAWSMVTEPGTHPGVWVLSDVVVTAERSEVVGRSVDDGERRWQVPMNEPHCAAEGSRIACMPSGPPSRASEGTITIIDAAGSTSVTTVPDARLASPLGEDLVVAGGSGDGNRWLSRVSPDGSEIWRTVVAAESSDRTDALDFHNLTVDTRRIVWWFGEGEFAWPDPGMLDPDSGERLPTLTAAPYTSSLPLEFERTLTYLGADSREPGNGAIMSGGVAESLDGPWLWHWQVDERPLGVTDHHVTTVIRADLGAAIDGGEPFGHARLRTRTLQDGDVQESPTEYQSMGCPCEWVEDTLLAHGIRVADADALMAGRYGIDIIMIEGTDIVGSYLLHDEAPSSFAPSPFSLATDGSRAYLLEGERLTALPMP
ncbi:PQQ-like beta-propeller repeat protein [Ruania halotolerans]|uniref:PQQ-like beta-propeller repeat protein n=1 Tax=Ruania halotolerans TaxID=2897773 RepID=UPI001E585A76|nr:PQQ-like beta-propeller repeat protein [Ruania halotolerans]UFU05868.1 PQQ-like beta-propeller repeat protein [Ruania halotolerans]